MRGLCQPLPIRKLGRVKLSSCTRGEPDEAISHLLLASPFYDQQRQERFMKFRGLAYAPSFSLRMTVRSMWKFFS